VDLPITPIIVAMRAPLLSATSNLDRSCTIEIFRCLCFFSLLLDDLHETPPFELAQWPRLHDANSVAGFRLVLFIVGVKLFHLLDDLPKLGVRHTRDCPHHNRLVHAAGNDFTGSRLA
jgi:hypothetical protein